MVHVNSKIDFVSDLLATLAWEVVGCIRETRSSHSYSVSTAVHPALAAIAARAGFRGTALVLVQEPVHPVSAVGLWHED